MTWVPEKDGSAQMKDMCAQLEEMNTKMAQVKTGVDAINGKPEPTITTEGHAQVDVMNPLNPQPVSLTNLANPLPVTVTNQPAAAASPLPVTVTNQPAALANPLPVTVSNFPTNFAVNNFPAIQPVSIVSTTVEKTLFGAYFLNGTSSAMNINATTATLFSINAGSSDQYIRTLKFKIADVGLNLFKLGAINALSNGIKIIHRTAAGVDNPIGITIKSNLDLMHLSTKFQNVGNLIGSLLSTDPETFLCDIDLVSLCGEPVFIPKNSLSKLMIQIFDDLRGLNYMDVIGAGYKQ